MSRLIVSSTSMIWHHFFQESHCSKVFNFKDNWGILKDLERIVYEGKSFCSLCKTYFIFRHCLTAGAKYKTQMGMKSQQGSWKKTLPNFLSGDVSLVSSSAPDSRCIVLHDC